MRYPGLPMLWRIVDDFLWDGDDHPRHIRQPDGKIDRMKVATILENHGYEKYAKAWMTTPLEASALEMLQALELAETMLSVHVSGGSVGYSQSCHQGNVELLKIMRTAIANAKGKQ